MILEFGFRNTRTPRLKFAMVVQHQFEPFEFNGRPHTTPDNIRQIFAKLADVDRIRVVYLKGQELVEFDGEEFFLDAAISFYERDKVSWHPNRRLPEPIWKMLQSVLTPMESIVIGTVKPRFAVWKQEKKLEIRANAARRAKMMRANAEAILAFLGEPI